MKKAKASKPLKHLRRYDIFNVFVHTSCGVITDKPNGTQRRSSVTCRNCKRTRAFRGLS